jgi:hypothetical protein
LARRHIVRISRHIDRHGHAGQKLGELGQQLAALIIQFALAGSKEQSIGKHKGYAFGPHQNLQILIQGTSGHPLRQNLVGEKQVLDTLRIVQNLRRILNDHVHELKSGRDSARAFLRGQSHVAYKMGHHIAQDRPVHGRHGQEQNKKTEQQGHQIRERDHPGRARRGKPGCSFPAGHHFSPGRSKRNRKSFTR